MRDATFPSLSLPLALAHMVEKSVFNNKRHCSGDGCGAVPAFVLRSVHVLARLLLLAAVNRSGYPCVDGIQDGREAARERTPETYREKARGEAERARAKKKERESIERTCHFLDYYCAGREPRSAVDVYAIVTWRYACAHSRTHACTAGPLSCSHACQRPPDRASPPLSV